MENCHLMVLVSASNAAGVTTYKKAERSDTAILGILGTLVHFRHSVFNHFLNSSFNQLKRNLTAVKQDLVKPVCVHPTAIGCF
jgi:hypothetical protein